MAKKSMTLEERLEEAIVKDGPYEVPGNWVWVKLEDISSVISKGTTPKGGRSAYIDYGVKFLRVENIDDYGYVNSENIKYVSEETHLGFLKRSILAEKDILISIAGTLGKTALVRKEDLPMNTNQAIAFVRIKDITTISPQYVKLFLSCSETTKELLAQTKVTAIPNLTLEIIGKCKMPLPPLKEQQKIVDRIESLFEKLDKAKELIEEVRERVEKRKSAILVKAFTGVLTEKWRKNNNISNSKLLDNIMDENKKIKKNFTLSGSKGVHDIPNTWSWIKLKDVCEKFKYGTSAKSQTEGDVPVIRMGNLQQGKIVWDSLVYTSDEDEINKYDLIKGDLLFNRTNSPELVGKTSIYNGEMKAIFAGYLIRIRVLNGIDSKYINYFMNSVYAKTRCMEVKSDGVSQSNINAEKLGNFDIPLPSSEEQNKIVKILDKLLEEESKIEELTQLEDQIELIKKSILAKAFRGELGTNSEEDESALELLKEILSKDI